MSLNVHPAFRHKADMNSSDCFLYSEIDSSFAKFRDRDKFQTVTDMMDGK